MFLVYNYNVEVLILKVIVQRCNKASVKVNNKIVGSINNGLFLLVGFTDGDSDKEIDYMVSKIVNLRIFDDDNGIMNKSVLDVEGEILSVSQFTLYADTKKGNRPSYIKALAGEKATILYDRFNDKLKNYNIKVETGIFGADMKISSHLDGPVTIMLEREKNE